MSLKNSILSICLLLWWIPANHQPLSSEYNFHEEDIVTMMVSALELSNDDVPERFILTKALQGMHQMKSEGEEIRTDQIAIVDFRLPSTAKRLWVIDLEKSEIVHNTLVAHGRNTGDLFAEKFSNVPGSYTSSLGFYVARETYMGGHGLSLYLDGMEPGINDKARERAIVMHGADYATESFIRENGRLGRSFGCPSVPTELHEQIISALQGNTCLFIFGEDEHYTSNSRFFKTL